jgi:hypothetical protein
LAALALVTTVVVSIVGCSKRDLGVAPKPDFRALGFGAPKDSTPKPHPTPPPDTTIVPVQFVSADSTHVGTTGASHWLLGNATKKTITMSWSLTADPSWPGFPITGSQRIGAMRTVSLTVGVPVPESAFSGQYALALNVSSSPSDTSAAYGTMRVFGNDVPPTPPPTPAVTFVSADSVPPGGTSHTTWQLFNESDQPFTMTWTLTPRAQWPGFPTQGTVILGAKQQQLLHTDVTVPDTAAVGLRMMDMEVTRPVGLPNQSSPGWIWVVP